MSTVPSPGEPPKPPEVPVSTNLQVSSYYAQLEWFRSKVQQMKDGGDPLWVLAIENGSPEYDAKIARLLRSRRPNLRYVVVSGARIYQKMMQKNPDLADCVVVVQKAFESWDGKLPELPEDWGTPGSEGADSTATGSRAGDAAPSSSASPGGDPASALGRFDLVHSSLWRLSRCFVPDAATGDDDDSGEGGGGPKGDYKGAEKASNGASAPALKVAAETWQPGPLKKAQELSCAQLLLSLARPRGTMLLFRNAASGVFDLRARLHAVLYERNGHRVHPSDLEPGGVPLAREICDQGMAVPWVERVDSQVDITDSVGEELSVDAARALGLVLGVDVQQLAQQDAELMEHVVEELCDHSLGGDGFDSGPVLVHTPLHAISCVKLEPQDPVVVAARAIEPAIDAKPAESGDGGDGDDAASGTPAKYFRDDLVKFWTEHGDSLSPVLPVLPAALARPAIEPGGDRRRVRQLMLAALAGIERGMPLVAAVADADSEDDAELEAGAGKSKADGSGAGAGAGAGAGEGEAAHKGGVYSGKEAGDWTMAKAAALAKGAESAEEDERAFYRTMRGTWGSFTGTGQGQIVELASQQADDGYNFGGGPVAVTTAPGAPKGIAPGSPVADGDKAGEGGDAKKTKKPGSVVPPQMKIASLELAQQAIGAVRDPWYPHGTKGGFFNAGLLNWHATRSAWLIRPLTQEPDAPPLSDDDIDEIVEELAKLQRTYTLPRPMRLGDIIDLYCEIWDAV